VRDFTIFAGVGVKRPDFEKWGEESGNRAHFKSDSATKEGPQRVSGRAASAVPLNDGTSSESAQPKWDYMPDRSQT